MGDPFRKKKIMQFFWRCKGKNKIAASCSGACRGIGRIKSNKNGEIVDYTGIKNRRFTTMPNDNSAYFERLCRLILQTPGAGLGDSNIAGRLVLLYITGIAR